LEWSFGNARVRAEDGVLHFEGSFAGVELIPLRAKLVEYAEQLQCDTLTVDLSKVERLEHTGLSILEALRDTMGMKGAKVVLVSPSKPTRQMLEITRLALRFEIQG